MKYIFNICMCLVLYVYKCIHIYVYFFWRYPMNVVTLFNVTPNHNIPDYVIYY